MRRPSSSRPLALAPSRARARRALFKALALLLVTLALAGATRPARACPSCDAGRAARAEIFADGFFRNLSIAVLPFLLIGAVCWHVQSSRRWR